MRAATKPSPARRGACPSLPAPMLTGDGLLARLVPAAPLTPQQLAGLARLARELGNGIVEVTARGKLQLRGLNPLTAPRLAEAVARLGIEVASGLVVETSALAGEVTDAAFDPRPLAREIEARVAPFAASLAPKVSVTLDAGGALNLGALSADIALTPAMPVRLGIALGGQAVGRLPEQEAAATVAALLARLAAYGPAARMRDLLLAEGAAALCAEFAILPERACPALPPPQPVGLHPLKGGGVALGLGLAFGHGEAQVLEALASLAQQAEVTAIEPVAGRALLLHPLTMEGAGHLRHQVEALGFIVEPDDPRAHIFACAGQPACGSARIETRALALALAPLAKDRTLHVSGCPKGCAHPAPTAFTIVGLDEGAGIVIEGSARAVPALIVPVSRLRERVETMLAGDTGK